MPYISPTDAALFFIPVIMFSVAVISFIAACRSRSGANEYDFSAANSQSLQTIAGILAVGVMVLSLGLKSIIDHLEALRK
jgi:hypothetical protein